MSRLIAVFIGLAAAGIFAACGGEAPEVVGQQKGGKPFQEEPPIKVRNGSIEVLTPQQTEWAEEGSGGNEQWTQDRDHGVNDGNELFVEVQYNDGTTTCTGQGKIVEIHRSSGVAATFKKTGKRVKLTPKNTFRHGVSKKIVIESSHDPITTVLIKENQSHVNQECTGLKSVHDLMCIASAAQMACR